MARAGVVYVDVEADTRKARREIDSMGRAAIAKFGGIFSATGQVGRDLAGIGARLAVVLGGLAVAATDVSKDFGKAVSGVGAVANATVEELERLRAAALEAGASTELSVSAREAADAEAELARAGVAVSDILGGALTGSISLANAGQIDIASSATIAAQAMNIFDLAGQDVAHVADVLAAGANKSAAGVQDLGEGLSNVGVTASATGLSLEDTVGALSLFADNALVGAEAGTNLKSMLVALSAPSTAARAAMDDLGISAYDAQGNFVGLENLAGQLSSTMSGLTQEQRDNAMAVIFGSYGMRAATLLYQAGSDGVRDYTEAVNDQGAASRVAAQQLDNLAGDVEAASGAFESGLIRVGSLYDELARSGVQGVTDVVNVLNDFADTTAFDRIGERLGDLTGGIDGAFEVLEHGLRETLSKISAGDVDAAFDAVDRLAGELEHLVPVAGGVGTALSSMALRNVPLIGALMPPISLLTGTLGGLVLASDRGRESATGLFAALGDAAREVGPEVLTSLDQVADSLSGTLATGIETLTPAIADLVVQGGRLVAEVLPDLTALLEQGAPLFDVAAAGISFAADALGVLADHADVAVPAVVALGAAFAGLKIAKAAVEAAKGVGILRAALEQMALQRALGAMNGVSGAALNVGAAAGTAKVGVAGLGQAILGINPWVAAAGIGVGILGAKVLSASKAKQEFEARVRAATSALRDEDGVLQVTTDSLTAYLDEAASSDSDDVRFVDRNQLDDLQRMGLTLQELSDLTLDPEGLREFLSVALEAGEISIEPNAFIDGAAMSAQTYLATASIDELTAATYRAVNGRDAYVSGNDDLLGSYRSLRETVVASAQAELSRLGVQSDLARSIVDTATANNTAADGTVDYVGALGDANDELANVQGTAADAAAAEQGLADALDSATDAFRRQFGVLTSSTEAELAYQAAIARLTGSIAENGFNLELNTEQGRSNTESALAMSEAIQGQIGLRFQETGSVQAATDAGLLYVENLRIQLRAAGLTEGQIDQLISTMHLTPDEIRTQMSLLGEDVASRFLEEYDEQLGSLPPEVETHIRALVDQGSVDQARAILRALTQPLGVDVHVQNIAGQPIHRQAEGGPVPGVGSGDIVPALLEPGEFVIRKAAARALGFDLLTRMNRVGRYAVGGSVLESDPGAFGPGSDALAAGHEHAAWHETMVGNLGATTVGRNIIAAAGGDAAAARQNLEQLLELYVQLSDNLGQAAADELVWANTSMEGFELLSEGALESAAATEQAAADAAEAARQVGLEHQQMHDVMFAVGDLGTDEYLAMLDQRLGATEEYSQEWYSIWQQIEQINADTAAAEQAALDEQERMVDEARRLQEEELADRQRMLDNLARIGVMSNAEYVDVLRDRLASTEAYSSEWFRLVDQIAAAEQDAADDLNTSADELSAHFESIIGSVLGAFDASTAWFDQLQRFTDQVGSTVVGGFDVSSEEGRRNRSAISQVIDAALANAEAVFTETGDLSAAQEALSANLASIRSGLETAGFDPTAIADLFSSLNLDDLVRSISALATGPAETVTAADVIASLGLDPETMERTAAGTEETVGLLRDVVASTALLGRLTDLMQQQVELTAAQSSVPVQQLRASLRAKV